jgi:hypothetical protein
MKALISMVKLKNSVITGRILIQNIFGHANVLRKKKRIKPSYIIEFHGQANNLTKM